MKRTTRRAAPTKTGAKAGTKPPGLTPAQIRAQVIATARDIALSHGTTLSPEAERSLLAPSTAWFANNPVPKLDTAVLRDTLEPLVLSAAASARAGSAPVLLTRAPGGAKKAIRNPRPRPAKVGGGHIRDAMKKAACHYLWFC